MEEANSGLAYLVRLVLLIQLIFAQAQPSLQLPGNPSEYESRGVARLNKSNVCLYLKCQGSSSLNHCWTWGLERIPPNSLVRKMAKLTDDADYDAREKFENVPNPLSDAGNHNSYYGRRLQTRPEDYIYDCCPGYTRAEMGDTDNCDQVEPTWMSITMHLSSTGYTNSSEALLLTSGVHDIVNESSNEAYTIFMPMNDEDISRGEVNYAE
ncbi:unnamed protein product [Protopolystoma xenopodis]|uniref:Uncharacterized protein n=1 Tax=Protopolystoma xenopodis TaxID=117903 RepID=A0A3S5B2L5_9PLAT|nr:unnamed protein product [Protopolystoma xenopodis]